MSYMLSMINNLRCLRDHARQINDLGGEVSGLTDDFLQIYKICFSEDLVCARRGPEIRPLINLLAQVFSAVGAIAVVFKRTELTASRAEHRVLESTMRAAKSLCVRRGRDG